MSDKTGIEWTDATWNSIRGCTRVSEGCRNCYAEGVAYRFSGPGQAYEGLVQIGADGERRRQWNGQIKFVEEHLLDPLKWKTSRRIFVNSMSDLFHPGVTDEMLDRIFAVMALCPQHTFQVLTKRPERMLSYVQKMSRAWVLNLSHAINANIELIELADAPDRKMHGWPLPNVWLGVSVEDQKAADARIPLLLQTPAAVRFLSCEPLLGPVRLRVVWNDDYDLDLLTGELISTDLYSSGERMSHFAAIGWSISGGESGKGPGIRPSHPDWFRSLRDQCAAADVPFFFKQWGEWLPLTQRPPEGTNPTYREYSMLHKDGSLFVAGDECCPHPSAGVGYGMARVGKKAAGDLLDGVQHHAFPVQP